MSHSSAYSLGGDRTPTSAFSRQTYFPPEYQSQDLLAKFKPITLEVVVATIVAFTVTVTITFGDYCIRTWLRLYVRPVLLFTKAFIFPLLACTIHTTVSRDSVRGDSGGKMTSIVRVLRWDG